jgi:hypothetical protein
MGDPSRCGGCGLPLCVCPEPTLYEDESASPHGSHCCSVCGGCWDPGDCWADCEACDAYQEKLAEQFPASKGGDHA